MLSTVKVHQLCVKHQWFTCGTNAQYDKMFKMVQDNAPVADIAMAIWMCSDNSERKAIELILEENKLPEAVWVVQFALDYERTIESIECKTPEEAVTLFGNLGNIPFKEIHQKNIIQ